MKILMVSSYLPFPLYNGGNIRLYNLLKNLSAKHEITLICEKRGYQNENDVEEVKKFCKSVFVFPRKKQWSLSNILKSGISSSPFLIIGHTIPSMRDKIARELIENNFDLIHVETFYVLQNMPSTTLPIVLAEHNIEYLVYERFAKEALPLIRPLLKLDIEKLKRKEIQVWRKVTRLIAVSEKEKNTMENLSQRRVDVVKNGVDLKLYSPKSKEDLKEKRILFIGDFKWIENRDTAQWILKKIWPKVKAKFNCKLWIVGKNIPESIRSLADGKIIFDSDLKDTSKIYEKSHILLSPIRVGGGTSFKILEAMACGVPVVTTALGKEGISNSLLSGETSDEIVKNIEDLLLDKNLYERIANEQRKIVENQFNWQRISQKLDKIYSEVSLDA